LTGVSAGAINAAFLANYGGNWTESVEALVRLWNGLRADRVVHVGLGEAARWGMRLVSGGRQISPPTRGLLNTDPLRKLLESELGADSAGPAGLAGIRRSIEAGKLEAIGLMTTNYATGQSITWVQGSGEPMWERPQRKSISCELGIEHIMASCALPLLFPAVRIGEQWHGDGGIGLTAPLSPSLHLGSDRILAISTRHKRSQEEADRPNIEGYPPPAAILGMLMNVVFLDMLDFDALVLERINKLLHELPPAKRHGLRTARLLVMRPSRDLARMATKFEVNLPRLMRFLTRGLGTRESRSPDFLAMLLFDGAYAQTLIQLGEEDAENRSEELDAFLAA
jgi:NTE family protein